MNRGLALFYGAWLWLVVVLTAPLVLAGEAPRPVQVAIPAELVPHHAPSTGVTAVIGSSSRTDPGRTPAPQGFTAVQGDATWYDGNRKQAAAGPRLRRALGPDWRGRWVRVCVDGQGCIAVRLTDWCACGHGRVIDLDRRSFAALADPSRGVIPVWVTPLPDLPATDR